MNKEKYTEIVPHPHISSPPPNSKLEELIKTVYADESFARTYPLEKMYPYMEALFYSDGSEINPEALLKLLSFETKTGAKDMPTEMFIYMITLGLVEIGILVKNIQQAAYLVCFDGISGTGTYSSCLCLKLGFSSEQLYVKEENTALSIAQLIQSHEKFNGQRAVHLKKIEHTPEGYILINLPIQQNA
jgi:hypothetical protein